MGSLYTVSSVYCYLMIKILPVSLLYLRHHKSFFGSSTRKSPSLSMEVSTLQISIIMLSYFIVRYLTNEYALKVKVMKVCN